MLIKSVAFFVLLCGVLHPQASNPWQKFVASPSRANFDLCNAQLSKALADATHGNSTMTLKQVTEIEVQFLSLVRNGNEYAAELCFQLYPIFAAYPADLEFFSESLGSFLKVHPDSFLRLLDKYNRQYGKRIVSARIVGNLGAALVDKTDKQLEEANERIRALESIRDTSYSDLKNECIKILKELKSELK